MLKWNWTNLVKTVGIHEWILEVLTQYSFEPEDDLDIGEVSDKTAEDWTIEEELDGYVNAKLTTNTNILIFWQVNHNSQYDHW